MKEESIKKRRTITFYAGGDLKKTVQKQAASEYTNTSQWIVSCIKRELAKINLSREAHK